MTLTTDITVRQAYAADASGLACLPDAVARPTSAEEVSELLRDASSSGTAVTAAGGQSSMTGGSICEGGILLSLRAMDRIIELDRENARVWVEPGIGVGDLKRKLAAEGYLFAPDPTSEEEASLGGAIACNASGARSLRYGATRSHVTALKVVKADGETVTVRRTRLEKNTVGYAPVQDPIDWFIGSEGTLGVVVAAELALLPLPEKVTGLGFPFDDERDAFAFVVAAREATRTGAVAPRCLEILDARALELVREQPDGAQWLGRAFVYTEQEGPADREFDFEVWLDLAARHGALVDDIVVFDSDSSIRTARILRHNVPATMAERGHHFRGGGGRRLGTDWAVPYPRLAEAVAMARGVIDRHGLEQPVMYGHAGNGHPHMDFIAIDTDAVHRVEAAIGETLRTVIGMGGTVAAEHGIGKVKRQWLGLQLGPMQLAAMKSLKQTLDPSGILGPGNLFI